MGFESILEVGTKALTQAAKKAYVKPMCEVRTLESLGLKMEKLTGDVVQIKNSKVSVPSRFCTPQIEQARQMNKIAVRQAKAGSVEYTYPKATAEDLKRLTSLDIAESYSRVTWINPKDGKVYHLLKQGETEDGKVIVRILDQDGAFIKEAEIVPKNIAIIDDFRYDAKELDSQISHGHHVRVFAQRNNPFANYELINVNMDEALLEEWEEGFLHAIDKIKGRHFDYISISSGREHLKYLSFEQLDAKVQKALTDLDNQRKNGTRILMSSGNEGQEYINSWLQGQIEGVGSITKKGKVSSFSASRNSKYTQHYEVGEYKEQLVYNENGECIGLNITGKPGCDYKFNKFRIRSVEETQKLNKLEQEKSTIGTKILEIIEEYESPEILSRPKGDTYFIDINKRLSKLRKRYDELSSEIERLNTETKNYRCGRIIGTSLSTPIRTAKLALYDMMDGVI